MSRTSAELILSSEEKWPKVWYIMSKNPFLILISLDFVRKGTVQAKSPMVGNPGIYSQGKEIRQKENIRRALRSEKILFNT